MSAKQVLELAVNLDDVTPELIGHAQQALMQEGALDCWTTAIGMKKNRPGVCLSLLAEPEAAEGLARRVLELTGAMGVRMSARERVVLDRTWTSAETRFGSVRIKLGYLDGELLTAKPEYEDALRVAARAGVPLREVMSAAEAAADALRGELGGGG